MYVDTEGETNCHTVSNSLIQLLHVYTNKIKSLAFGLKGPRDASRVAHKSQAGMKPRILAPRESEF